VCTTGADIGAVGNEEVVDGLTNAVVEEAAKQLTMADAGYTPVWGVVHLVRIHTYIYACVCVYTYMYMCVCVCMCVCVYVLICCVCMRCCC
jgi:hypothetical protein